MTIEEIIKIASKPGPKTDEELGLLESNNDECIEWLPHV